MKRFHGRVAIVTGGASGIGRAIAERLAAKGAKVLAWDIDCSKIEEGGRPYEAAEVRCMNVDVAMEDQVERAIQAVIIESGKLDIVVNAAGIVGQNGPFWEMSIAQWRQILAVNLSSVFLVSKAAAPHLIANGWGRIVNVASIAAREGPKSLAAYSASKAGMVGVTKAMAKDLAGSGVLVNAIAPTLVATELLKRLAPEYLAESLKKIPLGRPARLDEVSAMVAWLCSEECSFSTGAVFDVSGGRAN